MQLLQPDLKTTGWVHTIIEREKDDVKDFSRIGVNVARTFEQILRMTGLSV